jgi:hypothetical protein
LNQRHGGHSLTPGPPAAAPGRRTIRRLAAAGVPCQCLPGSLSIEAQSGPGAITETHPTKPRGVRVDPIAGNTELLRKFLRIDQADVRWRWRHHLSEVFCDCVDLVDIEDQETSTACGEQHDLARDPRRET